MAHTVSPLSCSRNISMEPDTLSWKGLKQERGGKKGQKTAFHLLQMKRKHNLLNRVISSRAGITASARNLQCMRDVADFLFVISLYFRVVKKLAQWRWWKLFLWMAAAVLQPRHKSRDPPRGELASSLLSQPLFSTKHDWSAAAVFSQSSGSGWAEEEEAEEEEEEEDGSLHGNSRYTSLVVGLLWPLNDAAGSA